MLRVRCELKIWTFRDRSRTTRGTATGEGRGHAYWIDFPLDKRGLVFDVLCSLAKFCRTEGGKSTRVLRSQRPYLPNQPNMVSKVESSGEASRQARKEGSGQQTTGAPGSPPSLWPPHIARLLERGEGTFQGNRRTTDNGRSGGGDDDKTNKELWAVTQFAAWEEEIRSLPSTATPLPIHSSRRVSGGHGICTKEGKEGRGATLPPVTQSWQQEATALAPLPLSDRPRTHFPAVVRSAPLCMERTVTSRGGQQPILHGRESDDAKGQAV